MRSTFPMLCIALLTLYGCVGKSSRVQPAPQDASVEDATVPDSASAGEDSGAPDSGPADASVPDSSSQDASVEDSGPQDAGLDGADAADACAACQTIAASLGGLRWALPCTTPSNGTNCSTAVDGSIEEIQTTTLSGTSGQTYDVTLHFRGIVEQKNYSGYEDGGAVGAEDGGGSNPAFFINGGTPSGDTWNIYELQISDPPQTYYLNSGSSGINYVWLVDYLATIPMSAGATVTLTANSVEGVETSDQGPDGGPVYVPGVPPYPASYDGQFVQMDVDSVVVAP